MHYKMIDYAGKGFIVMSAHEFERWQDHLERRFEDSAISGHAHLHVKVNGEDRQYRNVEEYLKEFTVKDLSHDEAQVLGQLFAVDHEIHHAWYGEHDIFQPFAGK